MRITFYRNRNLVVLLLMLLPFASLAQVQFHRGVNFTNWFQARSSNRINSSKFTKTDFENVKSLGCDVIRLPINLHFMTSGNPDYILDATFLSYLDQAVNWAEELHLHLIIDNHTFDPAANTDPAIGLILNKVWKQMAHHFKNRSTYIYYEILNEPHGIDDAVWGPIQQAVIEAIRTEDTTHFIIVGGANWNNYNNLKNIPVYKDHKLIYTFHFYDPFIFTHQGATWVSPSMISLSGVPFPYRPGPMPSAESFKGTWVEKSLTNYSKEGTPQRVKELIDVAVTFSKSRNVPIFCGEFGVYILNSDNNDRVAWYKLVVDYLNEKKIPWTMWDYKGTFGLFNKGSQELFEHDLNRPLAEAMKFNIPK